MPTHTSHWKNERILDIFMAPLIPATVIYPNPVFDMALSTLLCLHINWWVESSLTFLLGWEVAYYAEFNDLSCKQFFSFHNCRGDRG